jgi:hypothetical protein
MDILVACHSEEDGPLFLFYPPHFDTPVRFKPDYVDPYTSNRKWSDYGPESKTMIWTQHCPVYAPFSGIPPIGYSVFHNLFDDGWDILKPGGTIVIPLDNNFELRQGISAEEALDNFKFFLKRLLAKKHQWESSVVRREEMPIIVAAPLLEDYNRFIVFK